MNRRVFLKAIGASALASAMPLANRAYAQIDAAAREFVSPTTGSAIELGQSDFAFDANASVISPPITMDSGTVEFVAINGSTAILAVGFATNVTDIEQFLGDYLIGLFGELPQFELLEQDELADGYWVSAHGTTSRGNQNGYYCEYQSGAFANADLVVIGYSDVSTFQDGLADIQQGVVIGGGSPFLFLEDSQIEAYQFPAVQSQGTSTRTTRGTRGTRTTRGTTTGTNTGASTTVEDAIREHRNEFLESFNTWSAGLAVLVDEAATEADKNTAIESMIEATADWPGYSARARGIVLPPEKASLQAAYYTWGDAVSDLGNAWNGMFNQTNTADAVFDALDAVVAADSALAAELGA